MRDKCEARYLEGEEAVGGEICYQVPWMETAGMVPQANDVAIPHYLAPLIDPDFDLVANRVTPFELIEKAKDDMNVKISASPNAQRDIGDIDLGVLNH